jgi:hypothetical protein
MDAEILAAIKKERARVARLGGQARANSLSGEERKRIAKKASKAAAKARSQKARKKKLALGRRTGD